MFPLRLLLLLLAAWLMPLAADTRLYLKEGGFHLVREYEVKPDRIRFYSTERADWEEIPLDLVDLAKTRKEETRRATAAETQRKADEVERQAERAERREVRSIPDEPGVYWIDGGNVIALKAADVKVVTDKRRSILKTITPVPMVAGKSTLEIAGRASERPIARELPELYFRIDQAEQFTIVKTAPGREGTSRVVERWSVIPISKELVQERDDVPVFRYQVAGDLYRVWPQKPLIPGEYAFIQYTEGKGNTRVWDFTVQGEAGPR